ncbi:MAG TPA: YciI family protein [Polyangiaceae bacterium]|nr:YciI family protein [Polyangiaceae bacterium]
MTLFMVMHKMTDDLEKGVPPRPGLIQEMGELIGELNQKRVLHIGAGLRPTSERTRLRCSGGKCVRSQTPTRGTHELIDGFVMLKVPAMEDALTWAERLGAAIGDVEMDVGPVVEPWHLGIMEKPANPPLRVLVTTKAGADSEAGKKPSATAQQKIGAVIASMKQAGVFLAAERLEPSSRGARLRTSGTKRMWTDGPFAETKELISGFTILRAGSLDEARAFTERYAAILGDIEVDVRQVVE